MPIATADDILTEVMAHYTSTDTQTASSYIKIAIDRLCFDLPIIVAKYSLRLTADTAEYSFGSGAPWYAWGSTTTATTASVVRVESAFYRSAAGSESKLIATVPQEMDAKIPNWRFADSGTPQKIYHQNDDTGAVALGLYPAPSASSSPATGAGYPRVDMVTWNTFSSGFTGTVTVPSCIKNPLIVAYGALDAIYSREAEGDGRQWHDLYIREKGVLFQQLAGALREYRPTISNRPSFRRPV